MSTLPNIPNTGDNRAMLARIRAAEAYQALLQIEAGQQLLLDLVRNHDAAVGSNAEKRDCATFHARLADLALSEIVAREVAVARAKGMRP